MLEVLQFAILVVELLQCIFFRIDLLFQLIGELFDNLLRVRLGLEIFQLFLEGRELLSLLSQGCFNISLRSLLLAQLFLDRNEL